MKDTPFNAVRGYVIVSKNNLVLSWTFAYLRKDAIATFIREHVHPITWDEAKREGFRVERCTLKHEWRREEVTR